MTTNPESVGKWTAGKWLVNPYKALVEVPGRDAPICALLWPTGLRSEDETFANARLIAAAPEMAEELRFVRGLLAHSGAESGYCMCGDPVEGHNIGSGHSPVDSHVYAASQSVERIDAILAKINGAS